MTEVQDEVTVETGEGDPRILVRSFGAQAEMADDRTIEVRVVPFDEVATVADPPDFRAYREQFVHQVFDRNEKAANRVLLRAGFGHDGLTEDGYRKPGLGGVVGHGVELISREGDGYLARFKMHSGSEADTARELVAEKVLTGVSAEFVPIRNNRTKDNILQRVKAHLDSVLLTYQPAYSKSQVLAMREETVDDELLPPPINRALLEKCADLGIDLPEGQAILLSRTYTEVAWDGSASRWDSAEAYCAASAIDLNPTGAKKTKDRCHLPYKEPGSGAININGVRAALSRIGQGMPQDATQAQRDAAKATLERILNAFNSSQS